ncbi:hypothetical protein ECO71P1_00003 [Escherichia phage ECO71P1]|uniref:Uncharacterized protein n=1 Tax=Escherichia phage ECO71P1 TaxID=2968662 RepID=A0A9Y1HSK7_9CAUD|nr:hypothetical protein ECO71P1_00003 [Escherichia phage ECO71P1]
MTNNRQRIKFEGKEYEIDARARFVARDSNGMIWAYEEKPAWDDLGGQWRFSGDSIWCAQIGDGNMFEENRPASSDSLKEVAEIRIQEAAQTADKQYAVGQRDIEQLDEGGYYTRHIYAMTHEGLYSKSDIAAELAHRDLQIDMLRIALEKQTQIAIEILEKLNDTTL